MTLSDVLDRSVRAAVSDLLDLAPELDVLPDTTVVELSTRRPLLAPVAAGLVAVVGVGATVAISSRDASSPGTTPIESAPVSAEPAEFPTLYNDADQIQWYLPSRLPDGYQIVDLSGTLTVHGRPNPDYGASGEVVGPPITMDGYRWARRAPDGLTVEDVISASVTLTTSASGDNPLDSSVSERPATEADLLGPSNATIRGNPALVVGTPQRESAGWTVQWIEGPYVVSMQFTNGFTEAEARAIAEGTTVSGSVQISDDVLPEGFEPMEAEPIAVADTTRREEVRLLLAPTAPVPVVVGNGPVQITISTGGLGIDAFAVEEAERRLVDGVEYSIAVEPNTGWVAVRWQDDNRLFDLSGRLDIEQAMALATEMRAVPYSDAVLAAEAITNNSLTLPEIASVTLSDGLRATVRGEDGPVALCVQADRVTCIRPNEQTNPTTEVLGIVATFLVDGDRRMIAWNGFQPELSPDTAGASVLPASTGTGWFIDLPLLANRHSGGLGVRAADGSFHGVGALIGVRPTPSLISG